jgi:hypothetical protein
MKKRYFWAMQEAGEGVLLLRFRVEAERTCWLNNLPNEAPWDRIKRSALESTHPEVRRVNRMLAAGIEVKFPVEIGE